MKYILYSLILVSLTGCFTTRKACLRRFPPEIKLDTLIKIHTKDSIIYRDTTILVKLPGETDTDTLIFSYPSADYVYIPDTVRAKTEFANAKAWYSMGSIRIKLIQGGSFQLKLDSIIRENMVLKKEIITIRESKVTEIRYIPVIYKIALWMWIGVLAMILLLYLIYKVKIP
jgi:hypothetical protein